MSLKEASTLQCLGLVQDFVVVVGGRQLNKLTPNKKDACWGQNDLENVPKVENIQLLVVMKDEYNNDSSNLPQY